LYAQKKPIGTSQETGNKAIWACHDRDKVRGKMDANPSPRPRQIVLP
jgi:hypothetical protein